MSPLLLRLLRDVERSRLLNPSRRLKNPPLFWTLATRLSGWPQRCRFIRRRILARLLVVREPVESSRFARLFKVRRLRFMSPIFDFMVRQEEWLFLDRLLEEHLMLLMRRRSLEIWRFCCRIAELYFAEELEREFRLNDANWLSRRVQTADRASAGVDHTVSTPAIKKTAMISAHVE